MVFLLSLLIIIYILLTAGLYFYWQKIPVFKFEENKSPATTVSVLIAVRNEAGAIEALLEDLQQQSYSKEHFEVLLINDHSEDDTVRLVEKFQQKNNLTLRLLHLEKGLSGKKNAIAQGVQASANTLLVTTDGDCRVGKHWLKSIACFYEERKLKMITGPVTFFEAKNFREKVLELEFASLVGSGAASLSAGFPNMCNGANLAYERQAFIEVNGYQDSNKLASGDDEFLMHKIYRRYPGKVAFLKNKEALVETQAPVSWKAFFNQRRRWASKWENYTYTHIKLLALLVFGANVALVISFFLWLLGSYPPGTFLLLLVFKFMLEFLFLRSVLVYFGRKLNLWIFLITESIYPFYVVFFALLGRTGSYQWKDREISRK
ncbi:MAG TPA: glycosyltransferase [Cytophagaceae bacterium]|nr:glycosyltransferase [Cytophagaceae bacterium]